MSLSSNVGFAPKQSALVILLLVCLLASTQLLNCAVESSPGSPASQSLLVEDDQDETDGLMGATDLSLPTLAGIGLVPDLLRAADDSHPLGAIYSNVVRQSYRLRGPPAS